MKKFAIVTDSTTYFTEEEFAKFGIKRASLNIISGDETMRELDMVNADVYRKFDEGHKLTTSQPSPGEFLDIYESLFKEGYDFIFVLVIAEPLSGTHQSAKLAINMLDNPGKAHLFDSNMAAFGNEMLLLRLYEFTQEGLEVEEIVKRMEHIISTSELVMTSLDLVSMIKSGRLSKAKGVIGSLLRIKPVIKMYDGKLDLFHVARTVKKAAAFQSDYMKEQLKDGYNKLYVRICSHNSLEHAQMIKEQVESLYKDAVVTFSEYIGPVFNVHVGPKGFGLSWHTE